MHAVDKELGVVSLVQEAALDSTKRKKTTFTAKFNVSV
jgi:hypothetical protein